MGKPNTPTMRPVQKTFAIVVVLLLGVTVYGLNRTAEPPKVPAMRSIVGKAAEGGAVLLKQPLTQPAGTTVSISFGAGSCFASSGRLIA